METTVDTTPQTLHRLLGEDAEPASPFSQERVTITKEEHVGLDEVSEVIEIEVKGYTRHIHRPAYVRNPGCQCADTPAVMIAPPPPRLIPGSPYGVSFWVEVLLSKFQYGQPTHRHLQDLRDRSLPVSPGTIAAGLQALAPLFEPIMEGLYQQQMTETVFHNDETRWEVFVELEDKVGSRWYLWVTRSASVVFFVLDPHRSAAVPGAQLCRPAK